MRRCGCAPLSRTSGITLNASFRAPVRCIGCAAFGRFEAERRPSPCGAANRLRIRPTLLTTAPTASSKTALTTHDSLMPARPQLPTSAGPRRPIPLGWSKLQPPRNPWFRSRTTGRLPGRTRPRASVSSQMRGVPRGWWLGGSCGFVLQLRYVDPKVDVFLVQIAPSADRTIPRVRSYRNLTISLKLKEAR